MLRFGGPSPWLPGCAWGSSRWASRRSSPEDLPRRLPRPSPQASRIIRREKEAEAFLATVTSLLAPVTVSANLADWTVAHRCDARAHRPADRGGQGAGGAGRIEAHHREDQVAAEEPTGSRPDTARQLTKLLLAAADSPAAIPEVVAKRIEAEARQSAILDGYTFCRRPTPPGPAIRRRPTTSTTSFEVAQPQRARARLDGLEGDRAQAQARACRARKAAQPGRARDGLRRLLRPPGRRLRHDRGRDDGPVSTACSPRLRRIYDGLHCFAKHTLAERYKQPVPRLIPAHWIGNRWAQIVAGPHRGANLDPFFKEQEPRVHRAHRRGLLRLARLPPPAREFSGKNPTSTRSTAASAAQEEQPRLGLAHRRRGRRPLAS